MTSANYLPGILEFRIKNYDHPDESLVIVNSKGDVAILVEFKLAGFNLLKGPFDDEMRDFYINLFLMKQVGGFETEIVSSTAFHCDVDLDNVDFATFISKIDFEVSSAHDTGDFITEFYFIDVIYSEKEAEDGSDIYAIVNDEENRILRSKLAFTFGDLDE